MIENKGYSKIVIFNKIGFIIFSTLAMFFYPGGGAFVGDVDSYVFTLNFFSDLGLINPTENRINPFSPQLFAVSLIFFSLGQIFFYLFCVEVKTENTMRFILLKVVPLVSSLSLMLVGVTPNDIVPRYHFIFVSIWLLGLFLSISVVFFHLVMKRYFRIAALSAMVIVIIAIFSLQSIIYIEQLNAMRPLTQKILVYSLVIWFIVNSRKNNGQPSILFS